MNWKVEDVDTEMYKQDILNSCYPSMISNLVNGLREKSPESNANFLVGLNTIYLKVSVSI